MKKLLAVFALAGFFTACNNEAKTEENATDTATTTTAPEVTPDTSATAAAPALKDSVMQFKEGKVMIMVGGSWSALSGTVTTSNGRKVSPDGEVAKGEIKRKMEEGMMIDKDGQLMDKEGKPMDATGWE